MEDKRALEPPLDPGCWVKIACTENRSLLLEEGPGTSALAAISAELGWLNMNS